jgi:hypothetical protein
LSPQLVERDTLDGQLARGMIREASRDRIG